MQIQHRKGGEVSRCRGMMKVADEVEEEEKQEGGDRCRVESALFVFEQVENIRTYPGRIGVPTRIPMSIDLPADV